MALTQESALRKDRTMPSGKDVMQHRHFAVIADIIADMTHGRKIRREVAEHFANKLSHTNPRFDRDRFLAACDIDVGDEEI